MKNLITEAREQIAHLNGAKLAFEQNGFKTAVGIMANTAAILDRLCDALEKAERESGCEYCDGALAPLYQISTNGHPSFALFEPAVCPMCGKRLEGTP